MIVRPATDADQAAIVQFQMQMAQETEQLTLDRATLEKGVAALFGDSSKGEYHVAEQEGTVIACLMLTYEWSDWRNGMVLWIQSVYVTSAWRGKGVYRLMYEYVRERVKANPGLRGIRLYVDRTNKDAQQVYTKLGMNGEHYQVFEWMKS